MKWWNSGSNFWAAILLGFMYSTGFGIKNHNQS